MSVAQGMMSCMTVPHVLSIITLGVADMSRAVTFYEGLGWRRASSSMAEIAWFDLGGPWLGLFGVDALAADAGVARRPSAAAATEAGLGAPADFDRVTLALNLADEAAVDAALAEAVAAGGRPVKSGARADWGGYSGYFADPDGHLWECAFNPGFPIAPDGSITIP
jgi:hypothetical protein